MADCGGHVPHCQSQGIQVSKRIYSVVIFIWQYNKGKCIHLKLCGLIEIHMVTCGNICRYLHIHRFRSTVRVIVLSSEIPVTKNTPRIKLQFLAAPINKRIQEMGFRGGSVVKDTPISTGDTGSIPDSGRSHVPQRKYARVA